MLINAGADVNAKDKSNGYTPLFMATLFSKIQAEVIKLLIDKGADINISLANDSFTNGYTSLTWAIKYQLSRTADLLRKHGGKTAEELKAEGK